MEYKFELMTQEQAEDIAYNWHYHDYFSFYDMESDKEDLDEFLNPEKRGRSYFVVSNDNEVLGFFSFTKVADHTIDIGLGMRPDLVSKGNGQDFLKAGLDFAKTTYHPKSITLSVATFNQRAIKVYKKVGFKENHTFMQDTNGSRFEFLKMIYS
ncbi:GNAT family N-acetyltransferase [Paenisporosarcina indica]|uniref:GNAT family N-acetyltransferase n=1 Tax=Paenisporosarcina indica TaxID=650093 RepID=UPI00094FDF01|nr:GNAT family protein [Paenisporosarcina indica]